MELGSFAAPLFRSILSNSYIGENMKRIFAAIFAVLTVISISGMVSEANAMAPRKQQPRKIILVSIDGLRPDFYLNQEFNTPNLKSLVQIGAVARGMTPSFPSVTYPNHTTLATGLPPSEHGILSNTLFDWTNGPSAAWFWEASHIQSETLWSRLTAAGMQTAAVRWPVTVGAAIDYLVPEIFPKSPWYEGNTWDLTVQLTRPELMNEIRTEARLAPFTDGETADAWAANAAAFLARKHKPALTMVHLIEADHAQHGSGRDSDETKHAVEFVDSLLAPIIQQMSADTCIFIVGDHGFFDYSAVVNINRLFVDEGWIRLDNDGKLISWDVIAQKSGGQAAIYSKNAKLNAEVVALLRANESAGFNLVEKSELNRLGAYPQAIAAIEGKEGFSLGSSYRGPLVEQKSSVRGQHGYMPHHPKMHTGFLAAGCGIVKQDLGIVSNLDVAPTILNILGGSRSGLPGRVLNLHKKHR